MAIDVFVPPGTALTLEGAQVRPVSFDEQLLDAVRESAGPLVILSDGITAGIEARLAAIITDRGLVAIEVRSERWNGETPSVLSAACRGVISGFGLNGVPAAVAVLAATA